MSPISLLRFFVRFQNSNLGLEWDHVKHTLVISRCVNRPLDNSISQRTVLSFVSSAFDSVGLVASYTVRARFLLNIYGGCVVKMGR